MGQRDSAIYVARQVPDAPAYAASVSFVFAVNAAFVADASAPFAVFWPRQRAASAAVDVPYPAVAEVSGVPSPAAQLASVAVADISGPASHPPCSARQDAALPEDLLDGLPSALPVIHRQARHCRDFLGCKVLLPSSPPLPRGR